MEFGDEIDESTGISAGSDGSEEGTASEHLTSSRRTFLKAAVLGAGAAAVGRQFAPVAAYAHDASSLKCTANDVRIIGPGVILNEPCGCSGTFDAEVQFTVENNAAAERHCVTMHLCPTTVNGFTVGGDFNTGTIPGKTTTTRTIVIENYPCGAGLVCFGAPGSQPDGSFLKGEACAGGACCSTISWDVGQPSSDCAAAALNVIPSKCRHQRICIQGRGATTLDCDTTTATEDESCAVTCGSTTTLRACTTSAPNLGPFEFELFAGSTATGTPIASATQAGTCKDFTTPAITQTRDFTVRVTDAEGCATDDTVTITTVAPQTEIEVSGEEACNTGVLTFTASNPPGLTGCTKTWKVDGVTQTTNVSNGVLTYAADPDGVCHTVSVEIACGGCVATDSTTVTQCVQTTLGCTPSS